MKEKGILLIISGPSGTGKGTIVEKLVESDDYTVSISATTRQPRNYEENGTHYFFKTENEFKEMIEKDQFIEHANFCGNYYGTPKEYVEKKLNEGYNVILEIEVQGALQVKEKYNDVVLIFLLPPSLEELKKRLEGRGTEEKHVIDERILRATFELDYLKDYDYVVTNNEIYEAIEDVNTIIKAEKRKASRNLHIVKSLKGEN